MKIAREKDKEVVKVVEEVKNYVLKNEEQKVEIIWLYHNIPVAGQKKIEDNRVSD